MAKLYSYLKYFNRYSFKQTGQLFKQFTNKYFQNIIPNTITNNKPYIRKINHDDHGASACLAECQQKKY